MASWGETSVPGPGASEAWSGIAVSGEEGMPWLFAVVEGRCE